MAKSHEHLTNQRLGSRTIPTGRFRLAITEVEKSAAVEKGGKLIVPIDEFGSTIDPSEKLKRVEQVIAQKYQGDPGPWTGKENVSLGFSQTQVTSEIQLNEPKIQERKRGKSFGKPWSHVIEGIKRIRGKKTKNK